MAVIEVQGLSYTYPGAASPALRNVSFQIEAGQLVAVIGANGAGKSSLCLALAGLIPALFHGQMQGAVTVCGMDTRQHNPGQFAGRVGLVLQNPANQLSGMRYTVYEEVAFGLENLGIPRAEMPGRIALALQQVGLLDEGYFFFLEETDWCLRMRRAGWTIYHVPRSRIIHLQGQSKKMRPARAWVEYYRSLYRFFKKNRSPLSYGILRVFRFLKLLVNLLLTSAGLCLTLGLRKRFREKVCIYGYLLWWHVRGCPEHLGLKDARR
jgi:hypothetical protein